MENCKYCGTLLFESDRKCPACGAPIKVRERLWAEDYLTRLNSVFSTGEWNTTDTDLNIYKSKEE